MMPTVKESKEFIESRLGGMRPEVALIVGSGLGGVVGALEKPLTIAYSEVPHFPKVSVPGHAGQIVFGELSGRKLMVFSGRVHLYEGRSIAEVVYPVHVSDSLGVKILIVTNTAGGINPQFNPGDLMVIEDHINHLGVNPLVGGLNGNGTVRFLDMTNAYSARLREKIEDVAEKLQIPLRRGVYLATLGPSYETPAEVKAFAWLGADAVGMSTVPEGIIARYHNIEVLGISCITNLGAGISSRRLSHEEVLQVGKAAESKLVKLLAGFLAAL
ncbi:MAG: purine-nucleoside phosphorylase [Verrucomicrobiae bacterium]|nr:purine-nucleoside phosphorylase [Verrucomicrobiae bacterium]